MPARVKPALMPFSDGVIPTTLDKTLNPDGTHIMSLFTQWVPADWSDAPHTEELDAYADRLIDLYDQVAPGFKSSITHRDIVGPHEMEQEYGLIGGNIFHGELSLEQLFHMRPAPGYADYRTPIAGLYNGGSGTHAGGGVCGIPGWQAARAALADKKRGLKRFRRCLMDARRRAAVAAMLGARSMAVVGASARARQLRLADGPRGPTGFGACASGEPALRPHRRAAVRAVARRSRRARRCGAARGARPGAGGTIGTRRGRQVHGRRCCSGPRTGCARRSRRSPQMQAWRCAGRAAWDSSTTRSACVRSDTWSQIRCRQGGSAWSPIPGRRSRRCCGPAAGSDSGLRCRPGRSS